MKVAIIGTGYVGLVTGACLAEVGHEVICVDVDPAKVEMINAARAPIHEKHLPELLERVCGRALTATSDIAAAVAASDVVFIAVGTPAENGRIDLKYVVSAARQIGTCLARTSDYKVVVVKSTVIAGTTTGAVKMALEESSGKVAGRDFGLGMNPEFLTEGTAVEDFRKPDRLVLGGIDARSQNVLREIYEPIDPAVPRVLTNPTTAEMIKYASNAVLATMISFSNEIARLCTAVGDVDAIEVMCGVHKATYFTVRDGNRRLPAPIVSFLEPGCGFGGSCLPKDVTALIGKCEDEGLGAPLLRSVLEVNRGQSDEVLRLIEQHVPSLQDVPVAVLGLAFKPDTDDVRESPAFPIIRKLKAKGARLVAYDPIARPTHVPDMAGVALADSLRDAVAEAEVVVLVTRWSEFSSLKSVLRDLRRDPLVVDGRRVLDAGDYKNYTGIGRGSARDR